MMREEWLRRGECDERHEADSEKWFHEASRMGEKYVRAKVKGQRVVLRCCCMSRPRHHPLVVLALIAALLAPQPGYAWGREGHRIVARIAARNLWQATRDKLRAILGVTTDAALENAMATAAVWPDRLARAATGTARWHFINVPISAPFSTAGNCANHQCVIDQIENMRTRLHDNQKGFALLAPPDPPRSMTSQELAFLIHFVGDVHQPLHAAWNGDRGGGCVPLAK